MLQKFLFLALFTGFCFIAKAQDPQFSQFYANPLYLNPALTGAADAPRLVANYRNQWSALGGGFNTAAISFDHHFENFRSGVGIQILNDTQGYGKIKTTSFGASYSFLAQINEDMSLRLGTQAAFVNRGIDYTGLVFPDQLDYSGISRQTQDQILANGNALNQRFLDFSTGLLLHQRYYWVGITAKHLGLASLSSNAGSTLGRDFPMKFNLHAGLNIPLDGGRYGRGLGSDLEREFSFSPAVMFRKQAGFDQVDVGAYLTYSPFTLGAWYRGIPISQNDKAQQAGFNNHDAAIALLGVRMDKLSIGYSYDVTVSNLGLRSGGSHEISLAYIFNKPESNNNRQQRRRNKQSLACPKF